LRLLAWAGLNAQIDFPATAGLRQSGQILVEDRLAAGVAELVKFFENPHATQMRRFFQHASDRRLEGIEFRATGTGLVFEFEKILGANGASHRLAVKPQLAGDGGDADAIVQIQATNISPSFNSNHGASSRRLKISRREWKSPSRARKSF
jgi:hypothetical protein